ncbi:hypothetical protein CROQUDRAFT_87518 [Cronartium quercuum f. sp. fusiforme G11]|uniref:RNA-binding S4 domain-containing protein n=1 Tax=Cronartium quercuum f. sp. fusiforme G11 TaxID=708437 RepID=A0A9P6NRJ9_9BASI|nr:hypothetical protein CROQUDRAFT_87518 [Cronartium quercuum f. sp. fusiforme G11]
MDHSPPGPVRDLVKFTIVTDSPKLAAIICLDPRSAFCRTKATATTPNTLREDTQTMRRLKNPYNCKKTVPRMSWHPQNLFNLFQRTYGPESKETVFTKTSKSVFWQRWKSKAVTRGYHGDWIQEKKFKRHYLPASLPKLPQSTPNASKYNAQNAKIPLAALMYTEVERRLDVVLFRACFADSIYEARRMVLHNAVKLNGVKCIAPWTRLHPGDMIIVEPSSIPLLNPGKTWPAGLGDPYVVNIDKPKKLPGRASPPTTQPEIVNPDQAAATNEAAVSDESSVAPEADEDEPVPVSSTPVEEQDSTNLPTTTPIPSHLPFRLPPYVSPFLFVPPYLEVSFRVCSLVYIRHPTSGPGFCEIPTPWDADGEVMQLAWEWYTRQGLGRRVRQERKEWDDLRETRRNPFAEGHLRKTAIGGRVAVHGRYQGGKIGRARLGSGEPRLQPQL